MIIILQREFSTKEELEEKKKKAKRNLLYALGGAVALTGLATYLHHKTNGNVKLVNVPAESEEELAARREKKSEEIKKKAKEKIEELKNKYKEKKEEYNHQGKVTGNVKYKDGKEENFSKSYNSTDPHNDFTTDDMVNDAVNNINGKK